MSVLTAAELYWNTTDPPFISMLIAAELYWSTIDLSIHICVDST